MDTVRHDFRVALLQVEEGLPCSDHVVEGKNGIYTPKQVVGMACRVLLDTLLSNQASIQAGVASSIRDYRLDQIEARTLGDAVGDILEVLRGKARGAPS